jgi:hypothetical protein
MCQKTSQQWTQKSRQDENQGKKVIHFPQTPLHARHNVAFTRASRAKNITHTQHHFQLQTNYGLDWRSYLE